MIVYTANYGGKDKMHTPRVTRLWNKDLKFVYFTDQAVESNVWDVRVIEYNHEDPNRIAKWYKLHSHVLFPGEETLWVDSSMVVRKDPTKLFQGWDDMILRNHPLRTNIYEEAEICIKEGLDAEAVRRQILDYARGGCPKEAGLYINGILLRKPTSVTADLNEQWWQQIEKWSNRDQISLPYVVWANGFSFKTVDVSYLTGVFSRPGNHNFREDK